MVPSPLKAVLMQSTPPEPIDNCSVNMIRPNLRDVPNIPFAEGFGIRPMTLEESGLWEDIERDAEPFYKIEPGLFMREFGGDHGSIPQRCFLMIAPNGCAVGTISAWYDRNFRGREYGRIHWVAVRPAWQGKGLAKAGLSQALKVLAQWHDCAYLRTSIGRVVAIKLYLKFGFEPDMGAPRAPEAWAHFRAVTASK